MNYSYLFFFFFFNDTATTEIYTLSLHDALPICHEIDRHGGAPQRGRHDILQRRVYRAVIRVQQSVRGAHQDNRSEEHTSELQSRPHLVCRLLLEKKKI